MSPTFDVTFVVMGIALLLTLVVQFFHWAIARFGWGNIAWWAVVFLLAFFVIFTSGPARWFSSSPFPLDSLEVMKAGALLGLVVAPFVLAHHRKAWRSWRERMNRAILMVMNGAFVAVFLMALLIVLASD
ncbi:MAG: hypothetical protein V1885_00255 [Candidatus Brennerbacteria bacterium]